MCEPATLALAATAVAVVGQGVSAYGKHQQYSHEAKVARVNAGIENEKALDALNRGQTEGYRHRNMVGREIGTQRATMAANGLDLSFGNAADVVGDASVIGSEDSETIRQNAMRQSRGFEVNSLNFRSEAAARRSAATGALIEGAFGMATTALGGASQYSRRPRG